MQTFSDHRPKHWRNSLWTKQNAGTLCNAGSVSVPGPTAGLNLVNYRPRYGASQTAMPLPRFAPRKPHVTHGTDLRPFGEFSTQLRSNPVTGVPQPLRHETTRFNHTGATHLLVTSIFRWGLLGRFIVDNERRGTWAWGSRAWRSKGTRSCLQTTKNTVVIRSNSWPRENLLHSFQPSRSFIASMDFSTNPQPRPPHYLPKI